MTEERYAPVSCDYHDQLEAAAMHKQEVEIEFDLDGVSHRGRGRVQDVYTAMGAEWIRFVSDDGAPQEIRLDRIISMKEGG